MIFVNGCSHTQKNKVLEAQLLPAVQAKKVEVLTSKNPTKAQEQEDEKIVDFSIPKDLKKFFDPKKFLSKYK